MGVSTGSTIEIKLADSNSPVACIARDEYFFMHEFDILTAKEHHLPIPLVVFIPHTWRESVFPL